jgi:hypothetical protein
VRITTVPVLSTQTGLIYAYEQDEALAEIGLYAFYFEAIDYRTGKVVWRQLAGAGGYKNNNYSPTLLSPDGTLYQGTSLGYVWMRDNPQADESPAADAPPPGHGAPSTAGPTATCTVPKLNGRALKAATARIKAAGGTVGKLTRRATTKAKAGRVVGQSKVPGTVLPAGATVRLTVGKRRSPRPSVPV